MAAEQSSQSVTLTAGASEFVVGSSIPIKLTYKNGASTPIAFKEPLKTWETQFRAVRGDTPPEDRPFGRMSSYTTSTGIERRTVEAATMITLGPRNEVTFDDDVGARWPELFSPGVVRVSVVDLRDEPWRKTSNELTWRMVFKPESIDYLLAILGNAKSTFDAKAFAVKWLSAINTDFRFNIEHDDTATTHANQIALENYRKWWAANRDADSVAKQFAAINRAK